MKFIDLFDWVPDLNEMLNTKIPIKDWKVDNKGILRGRVKINHETFEILLEPVVIDQKSIVNVAFEKLVDGSFSQDLVIDSKNGSSILGVIINGMIDKIDEFEGIDFIVFCASNNIDKRMRIYNTVARRFMKLLNFVVIKENFKAKDGLMTILSKKPCTPEMLKKIEALQK